MIHQQYQVALDRRSVPGAGTQAVKAALLPETRDNLPSGRLRVASFASAPLAPSFVSVPGAGAKQIRPSDLTLDRFIDGATLDAAPRVTEVPTVFLTGANGYRAASSALNGWCA
jgi:hypothetical protein